MNAKKCDRCGQYYIPELYYGNLGESITYHHYGTLYCQPSDPDRFLDLCPKCSAELNDFLNEKRRSGKYEE